jgi:deoxyribodipyrimidine photo-lyase
LAALIQPERVRRLNARKARRGDFVVYWMQAAQRAEGNHALEYAAAQANGLGRPLVVFFGLTEAFPEANERHYAFLVEGLKETREALRDRGIGMAVVHGPPAEGVIALGGRASLVVVDDGYLRVEKAWRRQAAAGLECPLVEVATNVVVPVAVASVKEEYSAATLRPKILAQLDRFLAPPVRTPLRKDSLRVPLESLDLADTAQVLRDLSIARDVSPVAAFRGGTDEARRRLRNFVGTKLAGYAEARNDPALDATSGLSPYLHFGQISPLDVVLEVKKGPRHGQAAFLEQLIVRRELAVNFVHYNRRYDGFGGLPDWCRETLLEHAGDRREFEYSFSEFEGARTHDPYWNAAQKEMLLTGKMHGYMRMYWGKKILEWSCSPRQAFRTALALNNRYELDGRDANGFAGVAWCFGKHDRPWGARRVFGGIRFMNDAGLRRKFDADAYVRKVEALSAGVRK